MAQIPAPRNFRRSHRQAQKHFAMLSKRFNYHHATNRAELYESAKEAEDPSDPITALAFFNQFGQDFKIYPEDQFQNIQASFHTTLMTMIYLIRHYLDFDSPKVMPIYRREIHKLQNILDTRTFYNKIHLKAMTKQQFLELKQRTDGKTICNLYNPEDFQIPSLKRIVQVHLHRELALTTMTNLHKVKKDYSAQQYILHELERKNHLPRPLIAELLHLHINCKHHHTTLTVENGTRINLYHKILRPNSELHYQLVVGQCPSPLMNRIYSSDEAKVIFIRILRNANFNNMEIDIMIKDGFRTIHNYDPDYPRYLVPPLI